MNPRPESRSRQRPAARGGVRNAQRMPYPFLVAETVYNLFIYVNNHMIDEVGFVLHHLEGADEDKLSILKANVDPDYKTADRYKVRGGLAWAKYHAMERTGRHLELFEQLFQDVGAPADPLFALTAIVDGSPRIDLVTGPGAIDLTEIQNTPFAPGVMVDYLKAYVKDGNLDLPKLLNDDYFVAIKMLYNARYFVSAAKLLMSFLDTVAFVDLGDTPGNFSKWLAAYADLTPLAVTAKELWEFRNGLLHMTNLSSRAVTTGTTAPLILYWGAERPTMAPKNPENAKYLDLKGLLDVIFAAVTKWIETYNDNPDKLLEFVHRYDLTISDARLAYSITESTP
jgi:hypothetical protein